MSICPARQRLTRPLALVLLASPALLSACSSPTPAADTADTTGAAETTTMAATAPSPSEARTPSEGAEPSVPATPAREAPLLANQMSAIDGGSVRLGSRPGTPHRVAAFEADLVKRDVAAFEMDRLPYPNDPALPPKTEVSLAEATALCAAKGKRLCTEFEWEWACKGEGNRMFPTGDLLPLADCERDPTGCQSPFGVARLGTGLREWTASSDARGLGHPMRTAVVRGSGAKDTLPPHRCGARDGVTPDSSASDLGFRCCRGGSVDSKPYPVEPKRPLIQELGANDERIREVLGRIAELAPYASDFRRFNRTDVNAALRRGDRSRGSITAWHIAKSAFVWSPVRGEEYWLLTGRSQGKALIAVLYVLPDGDFAHAGSAIIEEEDAAIAVGYTDDKPLQLLFTTCFGCPGESGDIFYADDGTLQFVYR